MKKIQSLIIVNLILFMTLTLKGVAISLTPDIKPFYSQNDTVKHFVGEFFGGGVVFYVDESKQQGLICSISDIRDPVSFLKDKKQDPIKLPQADTKVSINKINAVDNRDRAVELCTNYSNLNYGTGRFYDWYLPTIEELEKLYHFKDEINKTLQKHDKNIVDTLGKIYWSSSKYLDEDYVNIWLLLDFEIGGIAITNPNIPGRYLVRAIRAF